MLLPFLANTTSPGLVALPPGMFSTSGTSPTTSKGSSTPRRPSVKMADTTAAAPPMSARILSMLAGGFSEMPPLQVFATWASKSQSGAQRAPVKADALAHQNHRRFVPVGLLRRLVAHLQENGGLNRALRHGQERKHLLLLGPPLVPESRFHHFDIGINILHNLAMISKFSMSLANSWTVSANFSGVRRLAGVSFNLRAKFCPSAKIIPSLNLSLNFLLHDHKILSTYESTF